ncbi:MAG: phenylacetate--CoA ligase, partial [Bacillota bacterium]|nr:phenylacetate--CoA ligase [Bacillota bacterium]
LRDNYPFGLLAVPKSEITRVHVSSGTTGKPTVVAYTQGDVDGWSEVMARSLVATGVTRDSVIHNAYGYGLFTGGLGIHYGGELIGATVIPVSGGNTRRQVMLLKDLGATVLTCTPSYALHLAEVMAEEGVRKEELSLQIGVFGAEPWSERMRADIERRLGLSAYDIYGLSEITGPGVACECKEKNGLHIWEDYFLPEIIDPETGEVLPPGAQGELVFTTLNKRGMPLIRYRTRDISVLYDEPCPCGRTSVRMGKVVGRSDDMLIIRGVNVFPSQIEHVLLGIGYAEPQYLLVVDRERSLDQLEVWVEVSGEVPLDEVKHLEEMERTIRGEIEAILGISVHVRLVEPKTIPRSEGKAKRVVDRREL